MGNNKSDSIGRPFVRRTREISGEEWSNLKMKKDTKPDWVNGERIIFWCWLFILRADCSTLNIVINGNDNTEPLYNSLQLDRFPTSHEERVFAVESWFNMLSKKISEHDFNRVVSDMRDEWAYLSDKIKDLSWLPKTEKATEWAWEFIKKKNPFDSRSFIYNYYPYNTTERYHAIVAAIDEIYLNEYEKLDSIILIRNNFITFFHKSYKNKFINKKDDSITQITVKISLVAKKKLDKLVKERKTTQRALIEQIILNNKLD